MLRRILVAQLLTVFLDPGGANPAELMEAFPEEFRSEQDAADHPPRAHFPSRAASSAWSVASEDLTDALVFLLDRHLVTIQPDGRVVPAAPARSAVPEQVAEFDFAACARDDAFATEPAPSSPLATRCDELGDLFGFEQPRLDA